VKRVAQLEPYKDEIERLGSLLFIAAEKRTGIFKPEKFLKNHPSSFPYLLDEDRTVTKAYGVYKILGIDGANIARPATLVIDRAGVVQFIYVGTTQFDRAPVESVLAALRGAA
jgi:peroxiredoxin